MLFLLNHTILDLGDPAEALGAYGLDWVRKPLRLAEVVRLGQEMEFSAGGLAGAHHGVRRFLGALISAASDANCGLFIKPEAARSSREVAVRLASAPVTTLAGLYALQSGGGLDAARIDAEVWRLAQCGRAA